MITIRKTEAGTCFNLVTEKTQYQMLADKNGILLHLWWGRKIGEKPLENAIQLMNRGFSGNPPEAEDAGYSLDTLPQEYAGCCGDYRKAAVTVKHADGSRGLDLRYVKYESRKGRKALSGLPYVREGAETEELEIEMCDKPGKVHVFLTYTVFPEEDVICRSARIENRGEGVLTLTGAASASVDFGDGNLDFMHFHGRHVLERVPERVRVPYGRTSIGSARGVSSHHENPFVILSRPETNEDAGDCWGFMLMYSGNHEEAAEKDQTDCVRLVTGIAPEGFEWPLLSGESFQTPEVIMTYAAEGFNTLSRQYHALIRKHVIPPQFRGKSRDVLLNSWEGVYFNFDAEKIVNLAKDAKALGVDLLVMDDGWFGHRNDDRTSLGDWYANEEKLGCSLKELTARVHALGMKFGLWVEPEMISEDSDLYRAHPDWALTEPGREPVRSRNQLVLDMSRRDVQDYMIGRLTEIIGETGVDYVKWDCNRALANVYSHAAGADAQGTVFHKFVLGLYRMLEEVTGKFPQVMIEGCAGGGGRFDAGILRYCPQIWCSDNTDPVERLDIQRGTSYGYPPEVMGSHVSASPNHQTGRVTSLKLRGAAAMSGTFGYELDPAKLSAEEKEEFRAQIADFRRFDALIRDGEYYRLCETTESGTEAWAFVAPDQSEALCFAVTRHARGNAPVERIYLKGLKEDSVYVSEETGEEMTGAALEYAGYCMKPGWGDYPVVRLHWTEK